MRHLSTDQEVPHTAAEICLNLWYYADRSGVVLRLAGKAYALTGSDEEKLAALHRLAATDHLTATQGAVPQTFKLTSEHGTIRGAIPVADIFLVHGTVFGPIMDQIERELPKGIRSVNDKYEHFTIQLPQEPLCVTTGVFEQQNGELIARVTTNP